MKQSYRILFIICLFIVASNILEWKVVVASNEIKGLKDNFDKGIGKIEAVAIATLKVDDATCDVLGSASISVDTSCVATTNVEWSTGDVGFAVTDLEAGEYTVTVTYTDPQCGATEIFTFKIVQTEEFSVGIESFGTLCAGPVTLTAGVLGGTPGTITYEWNTTPAEFTQDIVATDEGTYSVTATSGFCEDSAKIELTKADFFEIVYASYLCPGKAGSIAVNIVDPIVIGTEFFYQWSTGAISSGINVTEEGTYTVTVTSSEYGCSASKSIDVEYAPAMDIVTVAQDVSCYGLRDGRAVAFGSGGVGDISYLWSTKTVGREISNMAAGQYIVTATDNAGCTTSKSVTIKQPDKLLFDLTPHASQGICLGDAAILTVTVEGGKKPYNYVWTDDSNVNVAVRKVLPTEDTTYEVSVVDDNGCTSVAQRTTIKVSLPMSVDTEVTDIICHGVCSGAAVLNITGGVEPFSYSWKSPTNQITELCVGNYEVTITDLYNCTIATEFTIEQPDKVLSMNVFSSDVSCHGGSDGYIKVIATGGVPNYSYLWSASNNSIDSISVGAGLHYITVVDALNCSTVQSVNINEPEAIYVTNPTGGTICIGQDVSADVKVTGGKSPYTYVWKGSDGANLYGPEIIVSPTYTTSYTLTVTDSNGCTGANKTITVNVNPELKMSELSSDNEEICMGESVTIFMDMEGGNGGPYKITFEDIGTVNIPYAFYPAKSGYYKFTLSDGCGTPSVLDSIYIKVKSLPEVSFVASHTSSCPFGEISFSEVNPEMGQTYHWDFGDGDASNNRNPAHIYRSPGIYDVSLTVTSAEGCKNTYTAVKMIDIFQNPIADFIAVPDYVAQLNANVTFSNQTQYGTNFYWDFGDGTISLWTDASDVIHKYETSGNYSVMLIAMSGNQCVDTVYKNVIVHDIYTFYAPTAFTPNGDGTNDYFYISGTGIDEDNFNIIIFDRYGEIIFETDIYDGENPYNMAWDGTMKGNFVKGDKPVQNGVYIWRCTFKDLSGKPHEKTGQVTLLR